MATTQSSRDSRQASGQISLPLPNAAPDQVAPPAESEESTDQLTLPFRGWGTWHLDRRTRRSGLDHVHELRELLRGGSDDGPGVAA